MATPREPTEQELETIRKITDQKGGVRRLADASGMSSGNVAGAAARQPKHPNLLAIIVRAAEQLIYEDAQAAEKEAPR